MKRFLAAWAILLSLVWLSAAVAQFSGGQNGVPGCGPQVGGTLEGTGVPGCAPGVPSKSGGSAPPPTCTGAIDLSAGCALPMFGGL